MNKGYLKYEWHSITKVIRFFLLIALFFSQAAFTGPEANSVVHMAKQSSLTGRLTVVWGDGGIENRMSAGPLLYLTTDDQRQFLIQLSNEALEGVGGIHAVDRQWVSIEGISNAGAENLVEVSQIQLLNSKNNGAAEAAVSGSQKYVNILCRFKDKPNTPHPLSWFNTLFANAYPGLDHYWRESSFNKINLVGTTTTGWFNLPKNHSAYVDSNGNLDLGLAAEDCTAAADAQVFFPDYAGINMMFNEHIGNFAYGGGWCLTRDSVSGCWNMTWLPPWGYENQSPLAHEMGHSFGLPHSSGPYGETYDSSWDVMSFAWSCTTFDPNYGCLAQHTISHHKNMLGWISGARKFFYTLGGGRQTVHITNTTNNSPAPDDYLMAKVSLPSGSFYTVEARRLTGYDGVARIPGEAIIVHKVTPGQDRPAIVVDASNNHDPNDAGTMWVPGETLIDGQNHLAITIGQKTATGFYVTFGKPKTVTFTSMPQYDGTVTESAPDSGVGGTTDAQSTFLMVGDDFFNRQLCSVLMFATSSLPDNVKIISAKLSLQRPAVVGAPGGLGRVWVDVHKGALSGNLALQPSDFEAPVTAEDHKYLTASNIIFSTNIKPAYIGQKSATQLRLCQSNDNGNSMADQHQFYSGNAAVANRPVLVVTYHLP